MTSESTPNSALDLLVYELLEKFFAIPEEERDLDRFAERHPEHAELIHEEFPGLIVGDALHASLQVPIRESRFKPPAELGSYRIESEIGRGGMGIVYRARQIGLERDAAIKFIPPELAARPKYRERFAREARSLSQLQHPAIVQVFEYGLEDDFAWLAMQFVDGQALSDAARGRFAAALSPEERWRFIARIGAQVADALEHAHSRGIVHRDIKPGNLILTDDQKVWVTDFGLVKIAESDVEISKTGDMVGTPRYMAPEQARGHADRRSDIYALGITLWELCTGLRAWDSGGDGRTPTIDSSGIHLVRLQQAQPDVPTGLAEIIERACRPDANKRYQTARELQTVLTRFAHGEDVADRRRRTRAGGNRPYLRKRFMVLALLTAVLGGFVGATSWMRSTRPTRDPVAANAKNFLDTSDVVELPEESIEVGFLQRPKGFERAEWALSGADADHFHLDARTGELRCNSLDFESPDDINRDGIYEFVAQLIFPGSDSTRDQPLRIQVVDRNESPVFRSKMGSRDFDSSGSNGYPGIPPNLVFRADDPEGFGFHWRLANADESCHLGPFGRLVSRSRVERCDVIADDAFAQRVFVFTSYESQRLGGESIVTTLCTAMSPNGYILWNRRVELPESVLGVATADGERFFCVHQTPTDQTISLSVGSMTGQFRLLSHDCGLPAGTTGLATSDAKTFYCSVGALLHRFRLDGDQFTRPEPIVSQGYGREATRGFTSDRPNRLLRLSQADGNLHVFGKSRYQAMVHTYSLTFDRSIGMESALPLPSQGTLLAVSGWLEPNPDGGSPPQVARVVVQSRSKAEVGSQVSSATLTR